MASDTKSKSKNAGLDYEGKKKWSSRGELSSRSSSTLERQKKGSSTMESYSDDEDDRNSSKKRLRLFNFSSKSKRERNSSGDLKKAKSKSKEGLNKDGGGSGNSGKQRASRSNTISELSVTQLKKRTSREVKPVFGVNLQDAVQQSKCLDGIELPLVVRECLDHAEEVGLDTPGIYRISGIKSKIETLKTAYDQGRQVDLTDYDVTVVTGLLKQYLRELPEPILTHELGSRFEEAAAVPNDNLRVDEFTTVMKELPACNFTLLSWIMVHLIHVLDHAEQNKMSIQNLSIVFSPTMHISHRVLYQLFTHWEIFFGHVKIVKCRKPLQLDSSGQVQLPDSVEELDCELQHHEAMLNKMHEDLNKGVASKGTEEELWEVQRIVTQIKRKLRKAKSLAKQAAKESQEAEKSDSTDQRSTDSKLDEESSTGTDENKLTESGKESEDVKEPEKVVVEVKVNKEVDEGPSVSPEEVKVEIQEEKKTTDENKPEEEEEHDQEEEESLEELYLYYSELMAKQDELNSIRVELQRRIEMEQSEVERLRTEVEAAEMRSPATKGSVSEDESSSDSEDDGTLEEMLSKLLEDNERLKNDNEESSLLILQTREVCAGLRAKITVATRRSDILRDLKDEREKDKAKKEADEAQKGRKADEAGDQEEVDKRVQGQVARDAVDSDNNGVKGQKVEAGDPKAGLKAKNNKDVIPDQKAQVGSAEGRVEKKDSKKKRRAPQPKQMEPEILKTTDDKGLKNLET